MNIKRLMDLGCYRGFRHRRGPADARPAHPHQRRTRKGPAQRPAARRRNKQGLQSERQTWLKHRQHRRPAREQEGPQERRRRHRARARVVQQHHHHHHRPPGQCPVVGLERRPGLQGSRKSTPFAARWLPRWLAAPLKSKASRTWTCEIKGPGPGRESSVRALARWASASTLIADVTVPHNGCRPQKRRRIYVACRVDASDSQLSLVAPSRAPRRLVPRHSPRLISRRVPRLFASSALRCGPRGPAGQQTQKGTQVARYLGPKAKLSRREGTDLFLKSARRPIAQGQVRLKPGQHGRTSQLPHLRLRPAAARKQKVKRMYGVLERQFRRYFAEADRRKGNTGANLLFLLESRWTTSSTAWASARPRRSAPAGVAQGRWSTAKPVRTSRRTWSSRRRDRCARKGQEASAVSRKP